METNKEDVGIQSDLDKAVMTSNKITPIIEGLTLNQVEICFDFILKKIRNGAPIKFHQ